MLLGIGRAPSQADCLSIWGMNWLLLMSMTGKVNQARGQGEQTDARDHAPHLLSAIPLCQASPGVADRCATVEEGRGPLSHWPASWPLSLFPARFPQAACIVSWRSWGTDFEARKPDVRVGFVERVSEPRTYLANEVIITPGSLIG